MTKFHVKKDGVPDKCNAKVIDCPLGGGEVHFDNYPDAQKYADFRNDLAIKVENGDISIEEAKERTQEKYNIAPEDYKKTMPWAETKSTVLFNQTKGNKNLKSFSKMLKSAGRHFDSDVFLLETDNGNGKIDKLEECLTDPKLSHLENKKLEVKDGDLYLVGTDSRGNENNYKIRKVNDNLSYEEKHKFTYDNFDYIRENGFDSATTKIGDELIEFNKEYGVKKNTKPKKVKDTVLFKQNEDNKKTKEFSNMLKSAGRYLDSDVFLLETNGGNGKIDKLEECLTDPKLSHLENKKLEVKDEDLYLVGTDRIGNENKYKIRKVNDNLSYEEKHKFTYDNFDYIRKNGFDSATTKIGSEVVEFSKNYKK